MDLFLRVTVNDAVNHLPVLLAVGWVTSKRRYPCLRTYTLRRIIPPIEVDLI